MQENYKGNLRDRVAYHICVFVLKLVASKEYYRFCETTTLLGLLVLEKMKEQDREKLEDKE